MKKKTWVSLTLLFVTYFTLGWKLSEFDVPLHQTWFVALASILLLDIFLAFPMRNTKALIRGWFSSDIGAFLAIIVGAFVAVVVFAWLHLFATCLLLISAGVLARLDLQISGCKNWRAFVVLTTICLAGVGLGGAIEFWSKTGRLVFS